MTRFRKQHVSSALDDFGSGFASLLHLRDFPSDELKVDCGFARRYRTGWPNRTISRTMLDLPRNLGKGCVAEGIGTEAPRDFFLAVGCIIGQGSLFAKPMSGCEVKRAG